MAMTSKAVTPDSLFISCSLVLLTNMADDSPRIYSKPTSETIGEESPKIRQYPLPTPQRSRSPLHASIYYKETPIRRNLKAPSVASSAPSSRVKTRSNDYNRVKRKRRLPGRDFQQPQDWIGAQYIAVSLPQRVAFERNTLSLDENTYNLHASNKRSPSLGHVYWLQRLQSVTNIRQVQFQNVLSQHYQAILPQTHELPSPAPTLSHKKTRLPHRADVGFPNATPEEIESKQIEIRCETVQEEASLRLIALVPDLGRQVGEPKLLPRSVPEKSKYSILTPPLQSIPSASQGWRPRLIQDRPSYLEYLYVQCEAPQGCLALYNTKLQKISEDFWYSSGQKGIFSIPTDCDESLVVVWRQGNEAFGASVISHRAWPDLKELNMAVYQERFSVERLQSIMGLEGPEAGVSSAKKKRMIGRMFRTPQKPIKPDLQTPEGPLVTYKVRISSLGGDFLQPLLSTPQHDSDTKSTRLLTDVSGDFAVILEKEDSEQLIATVKKRSDLIRLPKAAQPAGFSSAAEFREVMYLPPSQHYEYDRPSSYWSMLNLMYLYPRALHVTRASTRQPLEGVSIRIRMCIVEDEDAVTIPESFYSASFKKNLVDEVVLDVDEGGFVSSGSTTFHDEFKLRLPFSLDKRYVLHVLLLNETGELLGSVQVPICSHSSSKTGKPRALTIIPNGNHRLKLGDFQLQLESRLVSTVHVSDPCVATFLRDCTRPDNKDEKSKQSASCSISGEFCTDSVLSNASESAVLAHFSPLLYSHLWNLTQGDEELGSSYLSSLFKLLDKTKQSLGEKDVPKFIKGVWDDFDEYVIRNSEPTLNDESTDNLHQLQDDSPQHFNNAENGLSLHNNKKGAVFGRSDERIKRIIRSLGPAATPFSRTAYGASKTDRMRLEAELQFEPQSNAFTPFFEDDETIATMPSILNDSRSFIESTTGQSERLLSTGSNRRTIIHSSLPGSSGLHNNHTESEFTARVKTVAKVILAPCVGPSLSSIISGNRPPSPSSVFAAQGANEKRKKDVSFKEAITCTVFPGSDDEHSREDTKESQGQEQSRFDKISFRGQLDKPLFKFSLNFEQKNQIPSGLCEYVYESVIVMWLRAWLDHVELSLRERTSSSTNGAATFPIPPFNFSDHSSQMIFHFYAHMDLLLPLCLKSFIFRYSSRVTPLFPPTTKIILDPNHMLLLEPFFELLARGVVGQVLAGLGSAKSREESLQRALLSSDIILDFLVGLISILHAEHSRALVSKFLHTLRNCETEHLGSDVSDINFQWDEESLHRVRCCRVLRIRTLEALLILPAFVNLNHPPKYSGQTDYSKSTTKSAWFQQYQETDMKNSWSTEQTLHDDVVDRLPKSGWLADLVIGEGLSVSALSSEAIVAEAMAQLEINTTGSSASTMSLRKRPGAALSRDDLLMFQSLGLHAINVVYELGLRRHALDRRYQSNSARERTAALCATTIMDRCLSSVRWLARMDSTQRIRSLWLLSFAFVLQEAPDTMLRHYVRCCCDPQVSE